MACKGGSCGRKSKGGGGGGAGPFAPMAGGGGIAGMGGAMPIGSAIGKGGSPGYLIGNNPYSNAAQGGLDWLVQSGQQGLQGLPQAGFDFAPLAQQARTQFNTETVPTLAERFTAMGNGQRSSAFESSLGRAGAGLEENLAALKAQYDYNNFQNQQQHYLNRILGGAQPQYQQSFIPPQQGIVGGGQKKKGGIGGFFKGLAGGIGRIAGKSLLGGLF